MESRQNEKNQVPVCLIKPLFGLGINLKIIQPSDFERLFSVASDPLIWALHPDKLRYTPEGFSKYFRAALEPDCAAYIVSHQESGEVMGSSRYYNIDPEKRILFIGFTFLSRKFWGGHWNKCLKALMIQHALENFEEVFFEAASENLRSISALKKIGAEEVPNPSNAEKLKFKITRKTWPQIQNLHFKQK